VVSACQRADKTLAPDRQHQQHPDMVRDAFRIAMEERPGPVLLELPEDVAGEEAEPIAMVAQHPIENSGRPSRLAGSCREIDPQASGADHAPRRGVPSAQHGGIGGFVRRTQIPFFTTQMGKGTVPGGSKLYMGTAALSERDYVHEAVDRADLIIAIGHDTIEKPPFIMVRRARR